MYMGMLERLSPWQLFAFSFWCCLCDSSHCSFLFIWERSDKHTSEAGHCELSNYVLLVEFIEGENCWSVLIFASFYLLLGVCSIALLSTTNHFLFACLFFFPSFIACFIILKSIISHVSPLSILTSARSLWIPCLFRSSRKILFKGPGGGDVFPSCLSENMTDDRAWRHDEKLTLLTLIHSCILCFCW